MISFKNSLLWKLTLAFMLVAITTAGLVTLFIRITSADRLTHLIVDQQRNELQSSLQSYYSSSGSWNGVGQNWQRLRANAAIFSPPNTTGSNASIPYYDRRRLFGLADAQGKVLVSVSSTYPDGTILSQDQIKAGTPIVVNGKQVGTLLMANFQPRFNPEENLFLQRTNEALIYAVIGAMLIALLIGIILARTLISPLQALTQAAQNIAKGELEQEVKVRSKDEIGQLAMAFNQMSEEVVRGNELRRKMTADIAHDLRTPLTVIAGYIESMRDGVLQPTTERLSLIYTEIERLQNLVGDLKLLSMADAGELPLHPQPVTPKSLLERVIAPFQFRAEKQNIQLQVDADESLPEICVDDARMMQVFSNLISNAMRYTPEGGEIKLGAQKANGNVVLSIKDNGSGIAEEDLPYIFDRFYRADKSRFSDQGESGLGLAIAKALVEAHGGKISAQSSLGQGTEVDISLKVSS